MSTYVDKNFPHIGKQVQKFFSPFLKWKPPESWGNKEISFARSRMTTSTRGLEQQQQEHPD